jgi:hypothetical protein
MAKSRSGAVSLGEKRYISMTARPPVKAKKYKRQCLLSNKFEKRQKVMKEDAIVILIGLIALVLMLMDFFDMNDNHRRK